MDNKKFKIKGMSCAACVARVERAVRSVSGVETCEVNLLLGSMAVRGEADSKSIILAVERAGYAASLEIADAAEQDAEAELREERKKTAVRLAVSSVLLLALMYISMGHIMLGWRIAGFLEESPLALATIEMLLSASIMVINKHFYLNGTRGIVHLSPNMDTLVSLGSLASFVYSVAVTVDMINDPKAVAMSKLHGLYFESAAMILVLITVGKLLESIAKGKTTSAIKSLMDLTPKTVTVIKDGKETVIAAKDVKVGDVFVVKRGENIAADGVIVEGALAIDESALTGESLPRDVSMGDGILGATTAVSGYALVKAERVGEETAISEIIKLVKEASGSKAPVAKAADKVAGIFVPSVLLISLVTLFVWLLLSAPIGDALMHAVAVLVVSCPCALGLATPVAVMVGSGVGAKRGILFKNAEALEVSGKIKIVALDKTGTITEGAPWVEKVIAGAVSETELIRVAVALEEKSEHPLARAIVALGEERGILRELSCESFEASLGGVSGVIDGIKIYGGNRSFTERVTGASVPEKYVALSDGLSGEGKTVLFFSTANDILGIIAISDRIKSDSADAIAELNSLGIETVMITGDNLQAAKHVAERVGISRVIAEVMPCDKARVIKELKERGTVCMVGDGINDSVALTEADVGIAIGKGADVAIDSASVVLTRGSLSGVPSAIKLGRRTLLNVYENLFWAFIYNIVGIPLAAGLFIAPLGWSLDPMFGAAAMSLSSFIVVMNALRLNLYDPTKQSKKLKNNSDMQITVYNKEEKVMNTVTVKIEGMMCPHCSGRVKNALEASELVSSADVSHERGDAIITLAGEVSETAVSALTAIITEAGYKVVG